MARAVHEERGMSLREFTDEDGTAWRVWETIPERGGATLAGDFKLGWLTFESETDRRRLSPVPAGWAMISDARLAMLSRLAKSIRKTFGDPAKQDAQPLPPTFNRPDELGSVPPRSR